MALVQRLIPVNSRLSALAARLGVPQYQDCVVKDNNTYTLLVPKPNVTTMSKRDVIHFMSQNVEINQDDFWLDGIPRNIFTADQLAQSQIILNAVPNGSGGWVGDKADVLWVDRNQLLVFKILVRRLTSL